MRVHSTAIVHEGAKLDPSVIVGPFVIIDEDVKIEKNTVIGPYTYITGNTVIGKGNQIASHACIGTPPQDVKFNGIKGLIQIGNSNIIREFSTIHAPVIEESLPKDNKTVLGNGCMLMVGAHIGHNTIVGDNVIMANYSLLSGHCKVEDKVFLSGHTAIHQFGRIGRNAMFAGGAKSLQDVPPYLTVAGAPAKAMMINSVGLQRDGYTTDQIQQIKRMFRIFYKQSTIAKGIIALEEEFGLENPLINLFLTFIKETKRGIVAYGRK